MILVKRLIPWLTGLLVCGVFVLLLKNPNLVWWLFGGAMLIVVAAVYFLVDIKKGAARILSPEFFNFLIILVFFVFNGLGLVLFIEGEIYVWLIGAVVGFFTALYLEYLFILFYRTAYYPPTSLENICSYLSFLTFGGLFSNLYNFYMWLGVSLVWLSLGALISVLLLVNQMLWVNKIKFNKYWVYPIVIAIILVELFWVIGFIPTSAYVSGMTMALIYYVLFALARLNLLKELSARMAWRYLAAGVAAILLILLTAKW